MHMWIQHKQGEHLNAFHLRCTFCVSFSSEPLASLGFNKLDICTFDISDYLFCQHRKYYSILANSKSSKKTSHTHTHTRISHPVHELVTVIVQFCKGRQVSKLLTNYLLFTHPLTLNTQFKSPIVILIPFRCVVYPFKL